MIVFITIILSFLCGSIPTGYILTKKYCGIDIRNEGSGNIGSTNVKRIVGRKMSILTQIGDIVKGLIPTTVALILCNYITLPIDKNLYLSIIALASILGHDYTPFLSFNGGKGVNTTLGAFFPIAPVAVLSGVLVYFILHKLTKIVSIRSISLSLCIPIVSIIMRLEIETIIASTIASFLIIIRHKDNIKRLIAKEEV
ncbi:MAG: glycerol-3-phosphate 1-O-acyltransferase PlsY [Clostridiaceae bacterium]|nr:glycerol-3-phosphate 1-O-acyltransferase PlsY [Clostridiaceae bacterium]